MKTRLRPADRSKLTARPREQTADSRHNSDNILGTPGPPTRHSINTLPPGEITLGLVETCLVQVYYTEAAVELPGKVQINKTINECKMCIKLPFTFFIVCNVCIKNIFIWSEYHYSVNILVRWSPIMTDRGGASEDQRRRRLLMDLLLISLRAFSFILLVLN